MKFAPNRPITTREPVVIVDAGLPPGSHRFSLVVIDSEGRASAPDQMMVTVTRRDGPQPRSVPRRGPG